MDWQTLGIIVTSFVGGTTLALAIMRAVGGGSWHLSGRLTSIESGLVNVQGEQRRQGDMIERQGRLLEILAEVRGDIRVINNRIENNEKRMTNAEQDIRDIQRGESYVLPLNKSTFEK